jgi:hypothetical protein
VTVGLARCMVGIGDVCTVNWGESVGSIFPGGLQPPNNVVSNRLLNTMNKKYLRGIEVCQGEEFVFMFT